MEPRIETATVALILTAMVQAMRTALVESIGALTKVQTSGQTTRPNGLIRMVTDTVTMEPLARRIQISSRTTLLQRMTTIAMVIPIDGHRCMMEPTVKDSSSTVVQACMVHRSIQPRAVQTVTRMVGPTPTTISLSIQHNSLISMAMGLVTMQQETTPMNVHSSLVSLMVQTESVVRW